jgi:hypothetical protein
MRPLRRMQEGMEKNTKLFYVSDMSLVVSRMRSMRLQRDMAWRLQVVESDGHLILGISRVTAPALPHTSPCPAPRRDRDARNM